MRKRSGIVLPSSISDWGTGGWPASRADWATNERAITEARARLSRASSSVMSISCPKPHSGRALVDSSLDRIEELNPTVNAFVEVDAEGALLAADEVSTGDERPFAG